jgi:hypothetical protein
LSVPGEGYSRTVSSALDQKGQLEAANRRKTDDTMAKINMANNDLHNITQKTKDQAELKRVIV